MSDAEINRIEGKLLTSRAFRDSRVHEIARDWVEVAATWSEVLEWFQHEIWSPDLAREIIRRKLSFRDLDRVDIPQEIARAACRSSDKWPLFFRLFD